MKMILLALMLSICSAPAFATPDKNFGDHISVLNLLPVASITTTGSVSSIDLKQYAGQIAITLDSKNTAGSSPTMAIALYESSDDVTYTAATDGAFTSLTTSTSVQKVVLNKDSLKRYLAIEYTIGGTNSPAYLMSAKVLKKYLP